MDKCSSQSFFIKEYLRGISQEIYALEFEENVFGLDFHDLAMLVYKHFGSILFGICQFASSTQIKISPTAYIIKPGDSGFFIGSSLKSLLTIKKFDFKSTIQTLPFLKETHCSKIGDIYDNCFSHLDILSRTGVSRPSHEVFRKMQSGPFNNLKVRNISDMKTHILICCSTPNFPLNIEYFILSLTSKSYFTKNQCFEQQSIVILSPGDPSRNQMERLNLFPNIRIVQGSPLNHSDLLRSGVERIKKAIVLSSPDVNKNCQEKVADAPALLIALNIEALCKDSELFIICEFIHSDNMKVMGSAESHINQNFFDEFSDPYFHTVMQPGKLSTLNGSIYFGECVHFFNVEHYLGSKLL
jgi:hypothetical protein